MASQAEIVPQISISSTDTLEADLDSLKAGLANAPTEAKTFLETLSEQAAQEEAVVMKKGKKGFFNGAKKAFKAGVDDVKQGLKRGLKKGARRVGGFLKEHFGLGGKKRRRGKKGRKGGKRRKLSRKARAARARRLRRLRKRGRKGRKGKKGMPTTSGSIDFLKSKMKRQVDNIDGHLRKIVTATDNILTSKKQFSDAVKTGAASRLTTYRLAKKKLLSGSKLSAHNSARSAKDVIDCTACRFAWLKVEHDLANTYSEKALYDSFVTHCANMQMSTIFFTPCNDMFAQADDMIGDYLNGHTVNQMCMNARMCR